MARNLMDILNDAKAERERLTRNAFCGPEAECEECGHKIRLHHADYGCEFERGDAWVDGTSMGAWMAMGPCGCTAVTGPEEFEREASADTDDREQYDELPGH
jgi:hypothetical protein